MSRHTGIFPGDFAMEGLETIEGGNPAFRSVGVQARPFIFTNAKIKYEHGGYGCFRRVPSGCRGMPAFCQFLKMGSGDHINDILAGMQHFVCKIFGTNTGFPRS